MSRIISCVFSLFVVISGSKAEFVHPGMLQGKADLEYMKQQVLYRNEPYKTTFENLKKAVSLDFTAKAFTHVSVGAYGANDRGSRDFEKCGKAAFGLALIGYVTDNPEYFDKAIEILNVWSYRLWDFDANNAKLTVGLFGAYFLNAAEILRYSGAAWQEADQQQFTRMVLNVFYPTICDFFTEANGNWDASMIYTMLCIGIFTDNREIFDRAVDRFYNGPGNSSIVRYIYPTGQCQETSRDWDHVQLGLGELAKAAQVAYTQGLDFYSVADCRLALGFEYAARFLLTNDVPCFGLLSQRAKESVRDIYESVYAHYTLSKHKEMPYTKRFIETKTRAASSLGVLTATRRPDDKFSDVPKTALQLPLFARHPQSTGVLAHPALRPPNDCLRIKAGQSIQKAIDNRKSKWIILSKGVHVLKEALKISSGITIQGEGKETVLMLHPDVTGYAIIQQEADLHDVTIRDLVIEGATECGPYFDPNHERFTKRVVSSAPSRGGIRLWGDNEGQIRNLRFEHLTIQNCTQSGLSVCGATGVKVLHCDFSDNGARVVPGAGFHHNLHLSHVSDAEVRESRFDDSLGGNGLSVAFGRNIVISDNEAARNQSAGIRSFECDNILIVRNLTEGNLEESAWHPMHPQAQIDFVKRQIQSKKEPFMQAYRLLIHAVDSVQTQPPHALADFAVPGFYDKPEEHRANSLAIQQDAFAAYCSALAYRLSGEKRYGEKAIELLNNWSSVNQKYSEHDGVLVMTYSGAGLMLAAELMSDAELWQKADRRQFSSWIKKVYQPAANEIRTHKNNWADWGRFG
ncbi:MAG: alginate lyase family protein, partial [Candidatus Symbiothrix sp.]|nr:alginate lyase family protein [Candidatus Symbiothrix sp.]